MTQEMIQALVLLAVDDDGDVKHNWDDLWVRSEDLATQDASGELRYRALVVMAFDTYRLPKVARNVSTSEGGQQGQWQEYFDHLKLLRDEAMKALQLQMKASLVGETLIAPLLATSLTPPGPGQLDPASPGYMGDVRYWRNDQRRLTYG